MTTTDDTRADRQPPVPAGGARPDARGLWRIGLALIAPLPMLAKGLQYVLSPVDGDAPFRDTVVAYQADLGRMALLVWLDVVFGALLVPATVALVWAARRGAPRLATAGALLSLPAFLTAFFVLAGPHPAVLTAKYGLNLDAVAAMTQAAESDPASLVVGLLFLIGIVVGLPVLGIALWRSHAVSLWLAAAIVLGAGTHPFVPGHLGQGIGLLIAAIGFAGASLALLRTTNDDFDLPPVTPADNRRTHAAPGRR
ncbi:MAG TPA: hypothetical protein VFU98_11310 [Microlunatus sp.]|nr:hypothetical protein [Microlunatus sp.]